MILALACGAGVGLGLLAIVRGLAPPRPPLAVALARLQVGAAPPRPLATPPPPGDAGGVAVGLVGVPLARLARRLGLAPRWLARPGRRWRWRSAGSSPPTWGSAPTRPGGGATCAMRSARSWT